MIKMQRKLNLDIISYDRFEANEEKSVNDTLGLITKCVFKIGILKHDKRITLLAELVELISSEIKQTTFGFSIVEEFGYMIQEKRPTQAISHFATS